MEAASPGLGAGSEFRWSVVAALPPAHAPRRATLPPGGGPGHLLAGKSVLLVEGCAMVRAVLTRALAAWGGAVCAVACQDDAARRLKRRPGGKPLPEAAAVAGGGGGGGGGDGGGGEQCPGLALRREVVAADALTPPPTPSGPFDVVIMDVAATRLLHALLDADEREAGRVVFVGWPGGHGLEAPPPGPGSPPASPVATTLPPLPLPQSLGGDGGRAVAPPEVVAASTSARRPGGRRLAYAVMTRPVRQARLWVALQEVLGSPVPTAGGPGSPPADAPAPPPPSASRRGSGSIDLASVSRVSRVASGGSLHRAPSRADTDGGASDGPAPPRAPGMRILLAEDNAINMKVAVGVLARVGHTDVTLAGDGAAALEAVEAAGGPDAFDVVLMDLHMPRLGGLEAVKRLRERWPASRVRVVAVTADAYEDTRAACLAAGFDGWLAKPFRVEDLAAVLKDTGGDEGGEGGDGDE